MSEAVVIGGSIAGMSAARVLADFYDRVTVVERDTAGFDERTRKGVPQATHVHSLLVRGRRELEQLFPGFDATAKRLGAIEFDFGREFLALRPGGWEPRGPIGLLTLWASRKLFESAVRERFRAWGRAKVVAGTVVGLEVDRGGKRRQVRGVTIRDGEHERSIAADLVVDAGGRASRSREWLRAVNVAAPEETIVDAFAGYSSLWIRAPSPEVRARWGGWRGLMIDGAPPEMRRAAVLFPIEDDCYIATLAGFGRDYPPADERAFRAALADLRSPIVAEAIAECESLSPVYTSRSTANRMLHYERWDGLDGFLAMGDSVCTFNPVYGQGMSVAVVCAGILRSVLAASGRDPSRLRSSFFRDQSRFIAGPWGFSTGADFQFLETKGHRPLIGHVLHPYMQLLMAASLDEHDVRVRIHEVVNMTRSVFAFFEPKIARTILARGVRRAIRERSSGPPPIPSRQPPM